MQTKQNKTKQNKTKQNKTKQNKTKQKQNKTMHYVIQIVVWDISWHFIDTGITLPCLMILNFVLLE